MVASLAVAALPFGIFVGQAAAETASDTVDVYAGLAPVMELSCEDVNFGVWRVPTGDRAAVNTITLTNSEGVTTAAVGGIGVLSDISLSGNYDDPQVGLCTVSGSSVADSLTGYAMIDSEDSVLGATMVSTNANPFAEGLNSPSITAGMVYDLTLSNATPEIQSGTAFFYVSGVLTIPAAVVADNYGAYRSTASHTVSFNDAQ